MTVNTINSTAEFVTNGVTVNFPFFFKFLANGDLVVTYIDAAGVSAILTLGTHYSVSGAGNENGGSVITTSALATGRLVVSREMDAYQQTALRNQGKFLAETHENVFDRLTMLIQQCMSWLRRALVKPVGKDYYDAEGRNISNLKDPVVGQDAATNNWVRAYLASVIGAIQGVTNNALNIFYKGPDNLNYVVQDLSSITDPAKGAALVGYLPPGVGAVGRTVYDKQRERLSLFDFMTSAERADIMSGVSSLDHTVSLNRAFASGYDIELPWGAINAQYIDLLDGVRAFGKGHVAGRLGANPLRGTLIRALPSAAPKFIRMPAGRVRGTMLSGITIKGDYVSNPTQHGLALDGVVSGVDGGLWDFDFNNLFIFNFGGDGFRLVGGYNDINSPMQFGSVSHVVVERPTATARALVLMGQCEHIAFEECRFDGTSTLGAVGTGSYMGRFDTSHDIRPNNITFMNSSFQRADIGIEIDRCENVVMVTPWFETINTAVNQKSSSTGLDLINPRFANVVTGLAIGSNCRATIRSPVVAGTIGNLAVGNGHSGVTIEAASKAGVPTSGVHQTLSITSGSVLDAKAHKFVPVSFGPGVTINTIDGYHMPGETITIFVADNSATFGGGGGNLSLGGLGSSLVVNPGSTISFIKSDTSGILPWRCTGHA